MSLTQDITNMVQAANNLTAEVAAKMGQIDAKVDQGVAEVQQSADRALTSLSFFTVNGNNNFLKYTVTAGGNPTPYKAGWGNGLDGKFETELIPVFSGSNPNDRPAVVKELLDFMRVGANTLHFSAKFNILRIKNISGQSGFNTFAFYIPWPHIKRDNWTYMVYCRGKGFGWGPNETFNGSNQDDWRLFRTTFSQNNGATGQYVHIDMYCSSSDAEIWIALPSIIPGIYPEGRKLPELFNITNEILDEHWNNYDALHDQVNGIWNPDAQGVTHS